MKSSAAPDTRTLSAVDEAVFYLQEREHRIPEIVCILGSGLGEIAASADHKNIIPTTNLSGYPRSTVPGHSGKLIFGEMQARNVLFIQGRAHLYEGHAVDQVTFPVRLAYRIGGRKLIITNAAGGINASFKPGNLMFIVDHINLSQAGRITLSTAERDLVYSRNSPYDLEWTDRAEMFARRAGVSTRRGVYVWTSGPSYETKAEIKMFAHLGADAVGMSTVPEVIEANLLGMKVLGISTITNRAAGMSSVPLTHEDVLLVGRQVRRELETLIYGIIEDA